MNIQDLVSQIQQLPSNDIDVIEAEKAFATLIARITVDGESKYELTNAQEVQLLAGLQNTTFKIEQKAKVANLTVLRSAYRVAKEFVSLSKLEEMYV